jgi:hypothetical protein
MADCGFRNAEFVDRTYIPQSLPVVGRRILQSEIMLVVLHIYFGTFVTSYMTFK